MALEDARAQAVLPEPVSRRILPRPRTPVKHTLLEERDSGYETDNLDQDHRRLDVKAIGRHTHDWDIRDQI